MTNLLSPEQDKELERLCCEHGLVQRDWDERDEYVDVVMPGAMAALREVYRMAQRNQREKDAQIIETFGTRSDSWRLQELAAAIRAAEGGGE